MKIQNRVNKFLKMKIIHRPINVKKGQCMIKEIVQIVQRTQYKNLWNNIIEMKNQSAEQREACTNTGCFCHMFSWRASLSCFMEKATIEFSNFICLRLQAVVANWPTPKCIPCLQFKYFPHNCMWLTKRLKK